MTSWGFRQQSIFEKNVNFAVFSDYLCMAESFKREKNKRADIVIRPVNIVSRPDLRDVSGNVSGNITSNSMVYKYSPKMAVHTFIPVL